MEMTQSNNKSNISQEDANTSKSLNKQPLLGEGISKDPNNLNFVGTSYEFNNYKASFNQSRPKQIQEFHLQINGTYGKVQIPSTASNIFSLFTCCPPECDRCVCIFSCIMCVLFWWILIPATYCCIKKTFQNLGTVTIQLDFYEQLRQFSKFTNIKLKRFYLKVQDNEINASKVQFIKVFLQQTKTSQFYFQNLALDYANEQSGKYFLKYMKQITDLPNLKYNIRWKQQFIQN